MLKLYHNDMSVCAQKVRMVLVEKNVEWEGPNMNLRAGEQFSPAFVKLNPKAVVPVIVHNGRVITESNAIVEYLDEAFPEPPLMPSDAADRAIVRKWLIRLDAGLHKQVASLSFAIAFRHQVLAVRTTPEALEEFYASIPDLDRSLEMREMVEQGFDSQLLRISVHAYLKLLSDMEKALSKNPWLVGDRLSLADIGYAPYITRLEHLQLHHWWEGLPGLAAWHERIKETRGFKEGMAKWFNPKYLPLMKEQGELAWPRIQQIMGQA